MLALLLAVFLWLAAWWGLLAWALVAWVPLPAAPQGLWVNELGELRLAGFEEGGKRRARPALLTPALVMLRWQGRWYWIFQQELAEGDWRRLHRCLRSRGGDKH